YIGIVNASTQNIPLGSNYPEMPVPIGSPVGNAGYPQPTIDWTPNGRKAAGTITDAAWGTLLTLVSRPGDNYNDSQPSGTNTFVTPAYDVTGTAWTNPNNAVNNYTVSTSTASTSTVNAKLFLPFPAIGVNGLSVNDLQLNLWGYSSGGTQTVGACI